MAGRYFGHKVTIKGIEFDSKVEADVYFRLCEKEKAGEISQLRRQVSFEIIPKLTQKEIKHLKTKDKIVERLVSRRKIYTCDFLFRQGDKIVILEVKNFIIKLARDYPLRRDLMAQKILVHNEKRGRNTFSFIEIEQLKNKQLKQTRIV